MTIHSHEYEFHGDDSQLFCEKIFQAVTTPNFPEQARLLESLLKRSQLSADQFAERSFVKPGTFRKYLAGYQQAGKRLLTQMQQVADFEEHLNKESAERISEVGGQREEIIEYAGKLSRLAPGDQALAKQIIDRLEAATGRTANSNEAGLRKKQAVAIGLQTAGHIPDATSGATSPPPQVPNTPAPSPGASRRTKTEHPQTPKRGRS